MCSPSSYIRRDLNRYASGRRSIGQVVECALPLHQGRLCRKFLVRIGGTGRSQFQASLLFTNALDQFAIRGAVRSSVLPIAAAPSHMGMLLEKIRQRARDRAQFLPGRFWSPGSRTSPRSEIEAPRSFSPWTCGTVSTSPLFNTKSLSGFAATASASTTFSCLPVICFSLFQ